MKKIYTFLIAATLVVSLAASSYFSHSIKVIASDEVYPHVIPDAFDNNDEHCQNTISA